MFRRLKGFSLPGTGKAANKEPGSHPGTPPLPPPVAEAAASEAAWEGEEAEPAHREREEAKEHQVKADGDMIKTAVAAMATNVVHGTKAETGHQAPVSKSCRMIMDMGFSQADAMKALEDCGGDMSDAVVMLVSAAADQDNDADFIHTQGSFKFTQPADGGEIAASPKLGGSQDLGGFAGQADDPLRDYLKMADELEKEMKEKKVMEKERVEAEREAAMKEFNRLLQETRPSSGSRVRTPPGIGRVKSSSGSISAVVGSDFGAGASTRGFDASLQSIPGKFAPGRSGGFLPHKAVRAAGNTGYVGIGGGASGHHLTLDEDGFDSTRFIDVSSSRVSPWEASPGHDSDDLECFRGSRTAAFRAPGASSGLRHPRGYVDEDDEYFRSSRTAPFKAGLGRIEDDDYGRPAYPRMGMVHVASDSSLLNARGARGHYHSPAHDAGEPSYGGFGAGFGAFGGTIGGATVVLGVTGAPVKAGDMWSSTLDMPASSSRPPSQGDFRGSSTKLPRRPESRNSNFDSPSFRHHLPRVQAFADVPMQRPDSVGSAGINVDDLDAWGRGTNRGIQAFMSTSQSSQGMRLSGRSFGAMQAVDEPRDFFPSSPKALDDEGRSRRQQRTRHHSHSGLRETRQVVHRQGAQAVEDLFDMARTIESKGGMHAFGMSSSTSMLAAATLSIS